MRENLVDFAKRIGCVQINDLSDPGPILTIDGVRYGWVSFAFCALEDLRERVERIEAQNAQSGNTPEAE